MKVLDEYVNEVTHRNAVVLEERIRVLLRDRPRWLPVSVWRLLIRWLLIIETRSK